MRALVSVAVLFVALGPVLAQSPTADTRLIAIGDIHGAYDEFTVILKRAGLVNEQLKWSGGRATLAQTGDYTDRGTDVRKVMDLLMQIERDAKAAGGQVVALLGNHEVMNLIGDWRDVTPEICATFATPKSEERREESWKQYERLKQGRTDIPLPAVYQLTRDQWLQAHPPGCLEYREAMSPSGTYGRWLRQKDIAAEIGGTLFMHAGINPSRPAPKAIAEVNDRARAEIRRLDAFRQRLVNQRLAVPSFTLQQILDVAVSELKKAVDALAKAKAENTEPPALDRDLLKEAQELMEIGKWSLIDPEGPLWFRGYAQWDEATTGAQVTTFLDQLKLTRIVVGHTPTTDRKIQTRYQGRVILMDTGMLRSVYEGTPSALEISGKTLKALYPDAEQPLSR
jgi:Calcineurin-like phosphoesterase